MTMPFLTDEEEGALQSLFEGQETPEQSAPPAGAQAADAVKSEPGDQPPVPAADGVTSASEQPAQAMPEAAKEEDPGHPVPYTRFKEVNEQRKQHAAELQKERASREALERKLSEMDATFQKLLKAQQAAEPQAPAMEDVDPDDAYSVILKRQQMLEERHQKLVEENELQKVFAEIDVVKQTYPDIDVNTVLDIAGERPDVPLMDIARGYQTAMAEIEERAIARYEASRAAAAKAQGATVPPSAPAGTPRPRSVTSIATPERSQKPVSFEEAGELLRQRLMSQQE